MGHQLGRVLGRFPREDGASLKADDAREAVDTMNSAPIGDRRGVVLIGPLDGAHPAAMDALLKTLEDGNTDMTLPILFASDAGLVRGTIRSRCLLEWCPGEEEIDPGVAEDAEVLVSAALRRDYNVVLITLKDYTKHRDEILQAVAYELAGRMGDVGAVQLWEHVRRVLQTPGGRPSLNEMKSAFLLEARHG